MEKQKSVAGTVSARKRKGELIEPVSENKNLLGIFLQKPLQARFVFTYVAREPGGVGPGTYELLCRAVASELISVVVQVYSELRVKYRAETACHVFT